MENLDDSMENSEEKTDKDLPLPSYASKAMNLPKPRDVRVDEKMNVEGTCYDQNSKSYAGYPFKQVEFTQNLKDLMMNP